MSYTTNAVEELLLVEVVVYDPNLGATRTLYFSTGQGHTTGPAETPANTTFEPRIKQAVDIRRTMFAPRTTRGRSTVGLGAVVLLNGDAELDAFVTYGVDGRAITIRRGPAGAAYPAGFDTVFVGTMANVEVTQDEVRLLLRDNQVLLNVPLQTTKYAGDNVLPDGLEGVADDLLGKPKPVLLGTVLNIRPPRVNTSKRIYQFADDEADSLDAVYDSGVELGDPTDWAQGSAVGTTFADQVNQIVYGEDLDMLICINNASSPAELGTSTDGGYTWTLQTHAFTGQIIGVMYGGATGNRRWMLVGDGGEVATSPDGITWTAQTTGVANNFKAVAWFEYAQLWVIAGSTGKMMTSADHGVTWVNRTSSFGTSDINVLAAGPTVIVAGSGPSANLGKLAYSSDAANWTQTSSAVGTNFAADWLDGLYANGEFRIVGDSGLIIRSRDGISWGRMENPFDGLAGGTARDLSSIAFGYGRWLVGGYTNEIIYGNETWERHAVGISGALFEVTFTGTHFVGAHATGGVIVTTHGDTYASIADLEDDSLAPAPGNWKVYLDADGSYFRLGAEPFGEVTCDATSGAAASNRYVGQLFTAVLTRAGMSAGDWNATDVTDIDTAAPYVLGFWQGPEETTCAAALDQVAGSVGAAWFADLSGDFRIQQLVAPSGTPVLTFTDADILRDKKLTRTTPNDPGQGVPVYRTLVRYAKNHTLQGSGLAAGVTAARRSVVGREWNEAQSTDATVQTAHPQAIQSVDDSLLTVEADAQAEATRRQALRGVSRDFFEFAVALDDDTMVLELNDVIELIHPRYNLSVVGSTTDGALLTVLGLAIDGERRELTITAWEGPADISANRITQDATRTYRITSDGSYRVRSAA